MRNFLRSVDQKCRTAVLLRSVAQTCPSEMLSEVWIRSVNQKRGSKVSLDQKCQSEVWFRSIAQNVSLRSVSQKCCSEVLLRSVEQNCCSEVSIVLQSGVSVIAQRRRSEASLRSVAHVAEIRVWKRCSNCRTAAQCCPEALLTRVAQKCRSKASLTCVCVCVCSEVLLGSADQKHRSEVWLRTVDQRCRSRVSMSSVESDVLLKSVARKCRSEVLLSSVDQKC